jgi:predicted RND superfamily exporter protein
VGQAVTRDADGGRDASRPLVERLGLAVIALVLAAVFGFVALAAWTSGEIFLSAMAGIGALMTVWAAAATLRRG